APASASAAKRAVARLAREREALRQMQRRLADELADVAGGASRDELERRLDAARAGDRETDELLAASAAESARLSEAVGRAEQVAAALPALDDEVAARQRDLADGQRRLEDARRKLADLDAAAADAGKAKYAFKSGAPIVSRTRDASELYFVVLSEGK